MVQNKQVAMEELRTFRSFYSNRNESNDHSWRKRHTVYILLFYSLHLLRNIPTPERVGIFLLYLTPPDLTTTYLTPPDLTRPDPAVSFQNHAACLALTTARFPVKSPFASDWKVYMPSIPVWTVPSRVW